MSLSINEYAKGLEDNGTRILAGGEGTFWVRYGPGAMVRIPTMHSSKPRSKEIRNIIWRGPALSVGYIQEPDNYLPANAWLYICTDTSYSLNKLVPRARRDVRRGLRELRIAPVSANELLVHGVQAFCDTRSRVGLSDGTLEEFKRRFTTRAKCPGNVFLGAWKDDKLAAFLSITKVDDWAEIEGSFSMSALLKLLPNDALVFSALHRYLIEEKCSMVSYGLSSIQAETNEAGLHAFKTKIGFEAKPVHRSFIIHPLLRPFANQIAQLGINAALRYRPCSPFLKKTGGMLNMLIGKK